MLSLVGTQDIIGVPKGENLGLSGPGIFFNNCPVYRPFIKIIYSKGFKCESIASVPGNDDRIPIEITTAQSMAEGN